MLLIITTSVVPGDPEAEQRPIPVAGRREEAVEGSRKHAHGVMVGPCQSSVRESCGGDRIAAEHPAPVHPHGPNAASVINRAVSARLWKVKTSDLETAQDVASAVLLEQWNMTATMPRRNCGSGAARMRA